MTVERTNEIKNCLQLLFSEQSSKFKEDREKICCALFFQYYLSVIYKEQAGEDFSFSVLFERVEKGRFQWSFYEKWMKNFADFLYLITGRQEAVELFDFVKSDSDKNEQRSLERFLRKAIRGLFGMNLNKEEAGDCLELFLSLYFKENNEKGCMPEELAQSLASILIQEQEGSEEKPEPILYGSGKGQLCVALKRQNSHIMIRAEEANQIWDSLSRLICFVVDLEKNWVFAPEEKKIKLGISLWPFGVSIEKDGETFPASCIPSQKEKYKSLGIWLSNLSDTGIFYSLCPAGFLYREGREKNLRHYLIEEKNLLDSIFVLPDALWNPGFPETVLLRFQKGRTEEESVYLLDASKEKRADMEGLTDLFLHRQEQSNLACLIKREEIAAQGMNLNPARYLETEVSENDNSVDVETAKKRLLEIEARLAEIEERRKLYTLELELLLPSNKNNV